MKIAMMRKIGTRLFHIRLVLGSVTVLILAVAQAFPAKTYDSAAFADIPAAIGTIGSSAALLTVSSPQRITRDMTIPSNISLKFEREGSFTVDHGRTVIVESPIQASPVSIFKGAGSIVVRSGEVFPQWWGARGNGASDDGFAIQSAIDSVYSGGGGTVRLPKGTYLLNHITGPYYALISRNRVSIVGEGKESVLKVGNNLRSATRGVAVLYNHEDPVTNCRFAYFTVDYNGGENLRRASWGASKVSDVSRLGAEFASDVVVEHVDFKDVTGAHCVYFGNQPTNTHNTVRYCSVLNVGQSVPGNRLDDHSSVYIGGANGTVSDNTFYNQIPCNISTAIEVHGKNMTVASNKVANYSTAINIAAVVEDCSDVTLTNNVFRNCRNGVVLWHYPPYRMNDIVIKANTISVREPDAPYPPSFGIVYGNNNVTSQSNMRGLTITDNTISQENFTADSTKPNTAIHLESVDDVTISRNTISNFKGEAIYIQSRSPSQGMTGMTISGNRITDVGRTASSERKRAIVFNAYQTPAGAISQIRVVNNAITSIAPNPMINGITFNSGYFPWVTISGNSISGAASAEIANNSTQKDGVFHVDHAGKGLPVHLGRVSEGSRWTDVSTGKVFLYAAGNWK